MFSILRSIWSIASPNQRLLGYVVLSLAVFIGIAAVEYTELVNPFAGSVMRFSWWMISIGLFIDWPRIWKNVTWP